MQSTLKSARFCAARYATATTATLTKLSWEPKIAKRRRSPRLENQDTSRGAEHQQPAVLRHKQSADRDSSEVTDEEISFAVVIDRAARSGNAHTAAYWLQEMLNGGSKGNVFAFNAVIIGFGQQGRKLQAIEWFEKMRKQELEPNTVTYNGLINACAKACYAEGAVKWFESMTEAGLPPTSASYNAVIRSFLRHADASAALTWLDRMKLAMSPDKVSYDFTIYCCAAVSPPTSLKAEDVFRSMRYAGFEPSSTTLNALERALGSARRDELCLELGVDIDKVYQKSSGQQKRR